MFRGGWGMLAGGRADVNLDPRQAITIRIYRPPAAIETGGSRTFLTGVRGASALSRRTPHIYVRKPAVTAARVRGLV
jgi:hypothetical protein